MLKAEEFKLGSPVNSSFIVLSHKVPIKPPLAVIFREKKVFFNNKKNVSPAD